MESREEHAGDRRVAERPLCEDGRANGGLAQARQALRERKFRELPVAGGGDEGVQGTLQAHQQTGGARSHLGGDVAAARCVLLRVRQQALPLVGAQIVLQAREGHGTAGAAGELAHPLDLAALGRHL